MTSNAQDTKAKTAKGKNDQPDVVSSFIQKTFQLLEDRKYTDIVDWNDEGTAIVIKCPAEFGQQVLPAYFKHNNLTSFVRQLNMYDFHKRRTQDYDHVNYHDLFQRDEESQLMHIKRKTHNNSLASMHKALETLKNTSDKQQAEKAEEAFESQLLKKLNKDAMSKVEALESKVRELTRGNDTLRRELSYQNQKENLLVTFVSEFLRKKGINFSDIPKDFSNQFKQLEETQVDLISSPSTDATNFLQMQYKSDPLATIEDTLSFTENYSISTEAPCWSPQSRVQTDLSLSKVKYEPEGLRFKSEPRFSMEQFDEGFLDLGDDFEGPSKAIKTQSYSYDESFQALSCERVNLNNKETGAESTDDFMTVFADVDAFLNYEPVLASFD